MPGQHHKKMRKPWDKDTITSRKAPRCVIPKRKYISCSKVTPYSWWMR